MHEILFTGLMVCFLYVPSMGTFEATLNKIDTCNNMLVYEDPLNRPIIEIYMIWETLIKRNDSML